jgi:TRAP transporter 4TM/12TM fusion protein
MKYRKLTGLSKWIFHFLIWTAVGATIFQIFHFRIADMGMVSLAFWALLLGIFLPAVFIAVPATKKPGNNKVPWYDICLAVMSTFGPAFIFINAEQMGRMTWVVDPPLPLVILGIEMWAIVLEGLRRTAGWTLLIIFGFFSVYPLFASHMPSLFFAKSYSLPDLTAFHFLSTSSMFGTASQTLGDILIGFMLFGMALQSTGAAQFLLGLAQSLVGRFRGAPALVSVVGSAGVATLSGSATSNVISVGTVTIPAMKKMGYEAHFAAAIETVASTGGMMTPPVMGSVAFIMAAFLEIPYVEVCIAAAIPMLIYYLCLFVQIYFHAQKNQMPYLEASEIPKLWPVMKRGWFYLGSIIILIYLMFYLYSENWAPYWATAFLFACAFIRKDTRPTWASLEKFSTGFGQMLVLLTPAVIGIGLLMGGFALTGVGESISGELVKLAGGNLFLLLLMAGFAAYLVGTAVNQVPLYIFMYVTFVPALVKVGIPVMAANLFFLYWAMISSITPPTCLPAFAAASIAGAGMMKTAWQAMRLGISVYFIPFAFVLKPALVAYGPVSSIVEATVAALIGAVFLASAVEGYMLRIGTLSWFQRGLMALAGIPLMAYPGWTGEVAGLSLGVLVILVSYFTRRSSSLRHKAIET